MNLARLRRTPVGPLAVVLAAAAILATMSWSEPPRYDGAGYATLGRALATGQGYRDIADPAAPPHAHFPPAYPAVLAVIWRMAGTDDRDRFTGLAHAASLACLIIGVGATARWYRAVEPRGVATALTLALAVNWTWVRTGGVIRSEPLALVLGGLTLLLACRRRSVGPVGWWVGGLALLLGIGVLNRQVTACWVAAVAVDVALRRGWIVAGRLVLGVGVVVAPWVVWQARAGSATQTGLFRGAGLASLVADQALFYARRIPDAVAGPVVEVATVFGRSARLGSLATLAAVGATTVILLGWVRLVSNPRRRLGGLIPLATLPLLLVWPFTEAGRFIIPLVPFVLLGAAEGGSIALRGLGVRRPRTWASRLVLAASIPYSAYAVLAQRSAAERRVQHDFDAACAWLRTKATPPGPVMARHPADVAWLTGRPAVCIAAGGVAAIAATIARQRVAYLVLDADRYARSEANPLAAFTADPVRVRPVWGQGGTTTMYLVLPDAAASRLPP